jgi:DNA-binding FrmR family transcriptional regulator
MSLATELRLASDEHKKELLKRLARIEGQIRGIRELIESEEDCERVAQQLAAAREAMNKVFSELVARTIEQNCLQNKSVDAAAREKLETIARILAKYA